MSTLIAKFTQGPAEVRRYMLDYSLDLNAGENLTSMETSISSPSGESPPLLTVTNVALAANSAGQVVYCTFFVSLASGGQNYEIDFLATTSLTQVIEAVVGIVGQVKT